MTLPPHIEAALVRVSTDDHTGPADADLLREYMAGLAAGNSVQISQARWAGLKALASQTRWIALMIAGAGGVGTLVGGGLTMLAGPSIDEAPVPEDMDDAGAVVPAESEEE